MKSLPLRPIVAALVGATCILLQPSCASAAEPVKLDVPYVPTPQAVVDRMLELGQVGPDDFLIDLGSGDGRIPVTAAAEHRARALGVDIDPRRIEEARANAREAGVSDRVEFRQQDLFETPLSNASVLTMYLLPSVNLKLRPRLLEELKPGTRVVSHAFDMGDWKPDQSETVQNRRVLMWIVPAQVEGRWAVQGDRAFTLNLTQEFQMIEGSADIGGRSVPLTGAEVEGDRIEFAVEGQQYVGRVKDGIIEADPTDGSVRNWRATRR